MKLKDLRPLLKSERVNLYIEIGEPIKYEIWGLEDETDLAEYRKKDEVEFADGDTMFLEYGDYNVDEIGGDTDGSVYIGINNN